MASSNKVSNPVYALVATAIAREGVTDVFGLMGATTIRLTISLIDDHGIRYHATRHEATTVSAADGYARVSGRVGVAAVTHGPAVTNTLTALTTAKRGTSPVVLLAGDSFGAPASKSPFARLAQGIDQELLMAAIDVPSVRIRPQTVARDVALAFAMARETSGPVALFMPMEYEGVSGHPGLFTMPAPPPPPVCEAADLAAAAAMLAQSRKPLILAGRGAWLAGAAPALVQLAEQTGALLATTMRGMGLFNGHPWNLGLCGGFSENLIAELVREADCVLVAGASLNAFTSMRGALFARCKIIQCDTQPAAFHQNLVAHQTLTGDARAVAQALCKLLPATATSQAYRERAREAGLNADSLLHAFEDISAEGALDPRAVCRRLDAVLPPDKTVVVDSGGFSGWPPRQMRFADPTSLMWMNDFGTVGSALGAAVGAAMAAPERVTVAFEGDGGLMMTLGELDLAVRSKARLLVVCMNDRAYGSELIHMQDWGMPLHDSARFETPDLAAVARSLGCEAERITRIEQLDDLGPRIAALQGPMLLDCLLTQELVVPPSRRHI